MTKAFASMNADVVGGDVSDRARGARNAAQILAVTSAATRDSGIKAIAEQMLAERQRILAANRVDLQNAADLVHKGQLEEPLLKRLDLVSGKFDAAVEMVHSVLDQQDPLEVTLSARELDEGLNLYRVTVPIGVLGVIFESRPDALVQIASLCLKSGNAVLLKGGREAVQTNNALAECIARATQRVTGIPDGWITLMETREDVSVLLDQEESIDLIVPRGGNEFVQHIMDNTNIPVMGHADGICHIYVDKDADLDKAVRITVDAKTQYVAVCNSVETLIVHADIAEDFFGCVIPQLIDRGVIIRGDGRTVKLVRPTGVVMPATDSDWSTEYLDLILAVKVVDSLEEAIKHINQFSSHHTDSIITEDTKAATVFLRSVDSSSVCHNVSTRFADGYRYGLGAEVGISTGRLHSRGPVGLEGLTSYKYILEGCGQIVDDYDGDLGRKFTHAPLDADWKPNKD